MRCLTRIRARGTCGKARAVNVPRTRLPHRVSNIVQVSPNIKYDTTASQHNIYIDIERYIYIYIYISILQVHRTCQVSSVRRAGAESVKCQVGRGGKV